ncbi:IPP transferase-domain-containing protein [Chytriomyces sp. MP71]|nr:IPP transferase-domain-containing protein [Chytriomyces sp. MP71]
MEEDSKKPVLVVVGTTGVGKSNLAIEIAQKVDGEIINADSMQVYKGLDIITNKVSKEEQEAAKHHLLGFVEPTDEYSVLQFEKDALDVIHDIHSRGKVPILVGGTHYYIQSILWDSHLDSEEQSLIGTTLASLLARVDPIMAARWHPNDTRKIRRSLQVYYMTGTSHSEILQKQKEDGGGALRFRTGVFWLWAENAALDKRLDGRVDTMIQNGLFAEITSMREKMQPPDTLNVVPLDYTRGILQTIGFKEFDTYFTSPSPEAQRQGIEAMQAATRRYARKQVSWIRNKLAPKCLATPGMGFWALDATDLGGWSECVGALGVKIAREFLEGGSGTGAEAVTQRLVDTGGARSAMQQQQEVDWAPRTCGVCVDAKSGQGRLIHGAREWAIHMKSNSHAKMVKRQRWKEERRLWEEKKRI